MKRVGSRRKISLDWEVVDPVGEELGDVLAFPLRGHMSHTVDRGEVHAIVADEVAGDLVVREPRCPGLLNGPAKHRDPAASTVGGHGAIGITRIEEDLVAVLLHDLVDPVGALILIRVVLIDGIVALEPSLDVVGDVERASHVNTVGIVSKVVSKEGVSRVLKNALGDTLSDPRCVLLIGVAGSVSLELLADLNSTGALSLGGALLEKATARNHLSEEIVPVETVPQIVDIVPSILANLRGARRLKVIEVIDAVVVVIGIKQALGDKVKVVHYLGEGS